MEEKIQIVYKIESEGKLSSQRIEKGLKPKETVKSQPEKKITRLNLIFKTYNNLQQNLNLTNLYFNFLKDFTLSMNNF